LHRSVQRLKAKCDEPLSNLAFNFNLRRYSTVCTDEGIDELAAFLGKGDEAGPNGCHLSLSLATSSTAL
jgi:hypothetical protein